MLHFGLGFGLGTHPGSDPTNGGQCAKGQWYFSDGFDAYARLWYHYGRYEVSKGKAETYSVEGDNSELRHYLACLARKSRCFSRCPYALQCALKLFVFAFNGRQLHKQLFPNYESQTLFTRKLATPTILPYALPR